MRTGNLFVGVTMALVLWMPHAIAQTDEELIDLYAEVESLPWQANAVADIGTHATIAVPNGYRFLGTPDASRLVEIMGNPPSPTSSLISPEGLEWFAVFDFFDSGYVTDDDQIDPDALLQILQEQNEQSQAERQRLNLPVLVLEGWAVEPHYDLETKFLEWRTRLSDESGSITINYLIKILGRRGVMNALLVSEPEYFSQDLDEFRRILKGFSFVEGERYVDFRQGDKVAGYGLAALIVGGAAAAAAKTGVFKVFGKFIVIGGVALLAGIGAFFRKMFRRT